MNLEYYKIFYYVARCKNMTKAAKVLNNDQPNITRYINLLENELGCKLLLRSRNGVTLTPEGSALYEHVSIAMHQLFEGEDEIHQRKCLDGGTISIGVSEISLRIYLLDKLKDFLDSYPNVKIKLSNFSTPQAITALEKGLVDFSIVTTPLSIHKPLQCIELCSFNEILLGGPKYKELSSNIRNLSELDVYPFVSLSEGTGTYDMYSDFFSENGLSFNPDMTAATTDQILPIVTSDLALGFYPEELSKEAITRGEAYHIRITEPIPPRKVCLIRDTSHLDSIAAKCLIKMMTE